jgi:hypothetical protein
MADGDSHLPVQRVTSPLTIVGLFVWLTEVVIGAVLALANSPLQWLMVVFVVLFPSAVAGAFFFFLWKRPGVYYGPTEFGERNPSVYHHGVTGAPIISELQQSSLTAQGIRSRGQPEAVEGPPTPLAEHGTEGDQDAKKLQQEIRKLQNELTQLKWSRFYDFVYRLLLGTQIEVLISLNGKPEGLTLQEITPFVIRHTERARLAGVPPVVSTPQAFMFFPHSRQLVELIGTDRYSITETGRGFLTYLNYELQPANKPL